MEKHLVLREPVAGITSKSPQSRKMCLCVGGEGTNDFSESPKQEKLKGADAGSPVHLKITSRVVDS
jgi:hypothetical protein